MSLPELLIGVGVGSLVLTSMMMIFLTSNRSFVAMGNYVSLDRASCSALEQMTRDIRNSRDLTSFASNQLVFTYSGSNKLVYAYNASTRRLTGWKTGGTTNTLLAQCDSLQFSMFNNIPQPGGTLTNSSSVSQAKAIGAWWKCSRPILGTKANTEYMQQAMIIIRNKPVK